MITPSPIRKVYFGVADASGASRACVERHT